MAAALVAAQWLGLLHRVAHLPAAPAALAAAAVAQEAAHRWAGWFGEHADERACLIFDHATCADVTGASPVLAVALAPPRFVPPPPCDRPTRLAWRAFDARAPPAFLG